MAQVKRDGNQWLQFIRMGTWLNDAECGSYLPERLNGAPCLMLLDVFFRSHVGVAQPSGTMQEVL